MNSTNAWIAVAILIAALRKPQDGMDCAVAVVRPAPKLDPGYALCAEGIGGA